jgi:hypothetical protein
VFRLDSDFVLPVRLDLCTGILPCALLIKGIGPGAMHRLGNGSIACLASTGCEFLTLDSVHFQCSSVCSQGSLLEFGGGSRLIVTNSSFEDCSSSSDGATIQLYGTSQGVVTKSTFARAASSGQGGVLSVVSGSISISDSSFSNSSASGGGGCMRISGPGAIAQISNTNFSLCSAHDDGGGIRIYGSAEAYIFGTR